MSLCQRLPPLLPGTPRSAFTMPQNCNADIYMSFVMLDPHSVGFWPFGCPCTTGASLAVIATPGLLHSPVTQIPLNYDFLPFPSVGGIDKPANQHPFGLPENAHPFPTGYLSPDDIAFPNNSASNTFSDHLLGMYSHIFGIQHMLTSYV
jgi:hypothetical protein